MKASRINQSNILFVMIQAFFTIVSFTTILLTFFHKDMEYFVPFCLGSTLFSLSWNNDRIYHRKFLTIFYFLFGTICILYGIINWRF